MNCDLLYLLCYTNNRLTLNCVEKGGSGSFYFKARMFVQGFPHYIKDGQKGQQGVLMQIKLSTQYIENIYVKNASSDVFVFTSQTQCQLSKNHTKQVS